MMELALCRIVRCNGLFVDFMFVWTQVLCCGLFVNCVFNVFVMLWTV
jgi:hypothetical protein